MILLFLFGEEIAQTPFWRNTNGPNFHTIYAIVCDSVNNILAYDDQSLLRSTDAGLSWEREPVHSTSTIVIKGSSVFLGNGTDILKSTDLGKTWQQVFTLGPITGTEIYFSSFCITAGGDIIAGLYEENGHGGIFRSTNDGENWTSSDSGHVNISIVTMHIDGRNRIFACTGNDILLSLDGGINWTKQNLMPISPPFYSLTINTEGTLFAGSFGGGIEKSTDDGQTWTQENAGLDNFNISTINITVNGYLLAGTYGGGLYFSTNTGKTWYKSSNGFGSLIVNSISSNSKGMVYVGTSDGFYRSTDNGINWRQINAGLADVYTRSFGFDKLDNVYAGTSFGLFYSTDHGISWFKNYNFPNSSVNLIVFGQDGIGLIIADGDVYRTSDTGKTWLRISALGNFNNTAIFHSSGNVFVGTNDGVFRSADSGITWEKVGGTFIDDIVISLAYSNKYIFAESSNGRLFRSSDLGDTWDKIQADSLNEPNGRIDIGPNGHLFASSLNGGIFRSTNDGVNWTYIAFRDTINQLTINSDGVLFAGTGYGVFLSSNEGLTWTKANTGLTNLTVSSIGIDPGGYCYAGTSDGPVFVSLQSTTSVEQTNNDRPSQFFLYQNYPNPFNPSTIIKYYLPNTSEVNVTVYDILGRTVRNLLKISQLPGMHFITFDASNLPSGIYFYSLQAGKYYETKKMMLMH